MQNILTHPRSSHVTALFADRMLSFTLPKGATFEALAARLANLDGRKPSTITVTLDS
jgi:hypothetical protein